MSILEDNKLIFNWMGGKCEVDGKGVPYTSRIPDYHSDWNQLMEVVEKIESGDYKVEIDGVFCEISSILKGRDIRIFIEGSIKIQAVYQAVEETMKGNIVLSVGFYPHASEEMHGETIGITPEQKAKLDELHKCKIDIANEVLVLNVGGYIGESTKGEIAHTLKQGKPIRYLEPIEQQKEG